MSLSLINFKALEKSQEKGYHFSHMSQFQAENPKRIT